MSVIIDVYTAAGWKRGARRFARVLLVCVGVGRQGGGWEDANFSGIVLLSRTEDGTVHELVAFSTYACPPPSLACTAPRSGNGVRHALQEVC